MLRRSVWNLRKSSINDIVIKWTRLEGEQHKTIQKAWNDITWHLAGYDRLTASDQHPNTLHWNYTKHTRYCGWLLNIARSEKLIG